MAGEWHAKATGGYARTSIEALDNASNLASALLADGWALEPICALLGNGAGESGLNPWRWESDYIPTTGEFASWTSSQQQNHGYGMFQFTPANKYINATNASRYAANGYGPNFSNSPGKQTDGEAQTLYFVSTVSDSWSHGLYNYYYDDFQSIGVDISTFYYVTYDDFKEGKNGSRTMTLEECTGAFCLCWERPADWAAAGSYRERCNNAQYWYDYFLENPPGPLPGKKKKGMPLWMYLYPYN